MAYVNCLQHLEIFSEMSLVVRKPTFCMCENKDADQLRGNRKADQRLCFRCIDSKSLYFLNTKCQASNHLVWLYSPVCVGPGRKPQRPVFSQRGSNMSDAHIPCSKGLFFLEEIISFLFLIFC